MGRAVTLAGFGRYLAAAILIVVPFHALLSVWVGSLYGGYDAVRVWKEVLLLVLLVVSGCVLWKDRALWGRLHSWHIFWLVAAYVAVHLATGLIALAHDSVSVKAALYGLVVNLRFVLFFLACAVLAAKSPWLRQHWRQLVCIPAALVLVFGLLQAFVLPSNVLSHVGYGPDTIPAYQTVDQKADYARVQSTLRGPNPLGAYLVVVIAVVLAALVGQKNSQRMRWVLGGLLAGSVVVLAYTYSRSAYIGAALAAGVVCWLLAQKGRVRVWLVCTAVGLLVIGGVSAVLLRQNDLVQNVLFHTNEHSASPRSSNQDRAGALQNGVDDVVHEPFGRGPGTAGPASVHNDGQVRIAENYYLQIGQEVGWIGLGLFVAILVAVGWQLLRKPPEPLAVALLASLVGIAVINMLSHAWTDDTLSLLWWGLAGIAAAPAILINRNEAP